MRLTLHTDYAIRTLIYLAVQQERLATIHDISEHYGISKNHMMKVAQKLVHYGFVISERGRNGGLRLSAEPKEINIGDVVEKMEPDFNFVSCMDPATNNCIIVGACGVQHVMVEAKKAFLSVLCKYTLQDAVPDHDKILKIFEIHDPASV